MRLAIIGAGPAGLAAAHALSDAAEVTVFEKSRGVSGRAATRWRDAPAPDGSDARWRYDHGAQYLSPEPDSPAADLVRAVAGDAVVEIDGAVWPFDADGTIQPDHARPGGTRWTFPGGIADLGRFLRDATPGLDLRRQTRASTLDRTADSWALGGDDGPLGTFDAVLMTAPAPQTAELLGTEAGADLADALAGASYRAQFTVVWAFHAALGRPADVYALVNAGGGHNVAWVAVESDKPGRAPDGSTLLLAQMSDGWTRAHYDDARADVIDAATHSVIDVWGALPAPAWTDTQRWRYALPDGAADTARLDDAADRGLFFAGDWTAGQGRVHLALEEGLAAAGRIRQRL
ncbi:NAD(P)/FAD-dependent oxidoreductase [Rubrivirga sp. IMCC45206]|uniref:NAD(P)/FAD-dependent oxidoreductase n=1 Tax=Rubrivirga sp. IMCC45206 TaxID=3391614 RepID=UPI00398FE5B1